MKRSVVILFSALFSLFALSAFKGKSCEGAQPEAVEARISATVSTLPENCDNSSSIDKPSLNLRNISEEAYRYNSRIINACSAQYTVPAKQHCPDSATTISAFYKDRDVLFHNADYLKFHTLII